MCCSVCTVLPQLSAEHMAFSIYYIQDEVEDRTSILLKTKKRKAHSPVLYRTKQGHVNGMEKQNTQVGHTDILKPEHSVGQWWQIR